MQKPFSIGVDLGGTNLRVAVVSRGGEIMEKIKAPSSGNVVDNVISSIETLFSEKIHGIGLGIAGVVDREQGSISSSPNLKAIENIKIVEIVEKRFGVPTFLENDANLAALGESVAGAGKNFPSFVLFTLGTGIGGGVIYKRSLMNIAAELGHMSIDIDGEPCFCGNMGCFESYASARAMINMAIKSIESGKETAMKKHSEGDVNRITPADIYKYALGGDVLACDILKNTGRYLGMGIANAINIFSPDAVVLAGGLIGAWDIYVQEAIKEASQRAFKGLYMKTKIVPSSLGDDAGLVGAASMVYKNDPEGG